MVKKLRHIQKLRRGVSIPALLLDVNVQPETTLLALRCNLKWWFRVIWFYEYNLPKLLFILYILK